MANNRDRPISIAMLALGGQGGGVLTGWIVETAEANGYIAQSTYVAGVAQRTGATVYCVEIFPRSGLDSSGKLPVFTPYPIPGDVDLVIAGEMAETARAIEKGFVTPNISTLIASSHRVYSMPEKEAMGDGIVDLEPLKKIAARAAKNFLCFDMQATADQSGSIISSVILGAIAASGSLPFERGAFEETIRRTGKAVEANLKGFNAGYAGASAPETPRQVDSVPIAKPIGANGDALASRIDAAFADPVKNVALHGALRTLDYQDVAYANHYLDTLEGIAAIDSNAQNFVLTSEVARQLALQMCYEDTIRVADLKTRGDRFEEVRKQVAAADDQPVRVVEYFHPRFEEFVDTLPRSIGSKLTASKGVGRILSKFFNKGRNITTTNLTGFLLLHSLAKLKKIRRSTVRYGKQQQLIDSWLGRITAIAGDDYAYAVAVARCIEIVKGYGDTYERGLQRYLATVDSAARLPDSQRSSAVQQLHRAALADEKGKVFASTLQELEDVA